MPNLVKTVGICSPNNKPKTSTFPDDSANWDWVPSAPPSEQGQCATVAIPFPRLFCVSCRGRPYWTLACPQSTCSGWDGHSFQRRSSISDSSFALPPAGFLQTDTRVHHTVTQDSPSRGAVTGHSQSTVHTSKRRRQNTGVQELLQNNSGENNI